MHDGSSTPLAERQILEVRGDRWHLGHAAGSVWAVYFATNRIFAGVYDANVNLVSHADWRPGRGVEHHDNLDALLSLGSAHWLRPCGVRPRGGRPRARWAWVSPPPSSRTVAA